MTDPTNRPTVTKIGFITAILAFALPFLADRLIVSVMTEVKTGGMGTIIGMAVYTALPFLLLDSAMRPRRRVQIALWAGLVLTALVWMFFALTGRAAQTDPSAGNAHVGLFMLTMIWPAVLVVLMGVAAKVGEKDHVA